MKITKIYIENFGCLSKYTKEFSVGINTIEEENGFGKTTLANFIKAMFYGFTNSKKNINDNDRLRYAPWQGGSFGGFLEFEHNNKKYRIERTFGETSSTKDTFKLYDVETKKPSKDYTKNIGEEIFKVDVDGYIRTAYMPQTNIDWSNDNKLSQNLTNLLEESSDINNFEKSIKALEAESKKYVKTGNKGLIAETEQLISNYELELDSAEFAKNKKEPLVKKQEELEKQLKENQEKLTLLKEQIKLANKHNENIAIANHYKTLSDSLNRTKKEVENLQKFFNGRYPTEEEINHNYSLLQNISMLQAELNHLVSNEFFNKEYQDLKQYLYIGTNNELTDDDLKQYFKKNDNLKKISIEKEETSIKIDEIDDKLENDTLFTSSHKMIYIILFFLGLILIIPGIIILVTAILNKSWIFGLLGAFTTLTGIPIVVASLIIAITQANKSHKSLIRQREITEECQKEKEKLISFYSSKEKEFKKLSEEIRKFVSLFENVETSFITQLKEDEDYSIYLNKISYKYTTYLKYKRQDESRAEKIKKLSSEYNQTKKEIDDFTHLYIENVESYQAMKLIQLNSEKYRSLLKQQIQSQKEFDEFVSNNPLNEEHMEIVYNLHDLELQEISVEKKIEDVKNDLMRVKEDIKKTDEVICHICELESKIDIEKELLQEYKEKYYLLTKTIEFLNTAKDKQSSSYLTLMQTSFDKYVKLALGEEKQLEFNSDLAINSLEYGMQKELGYFSTGYQDIIVFCARLALIDAVFKDIKPTIILDDPFANCDENKLSTALNMLKKLSNEYQIIYLICHNSRKVKTN